ncbi:MAG: hypothetical protein AB7O38_16225 [Pirellulaceae bacterium]
MGKLASVIIVLLLVLGVVGWWRDWFDLSARREPAREELKVEFTVDAGRVRSDADAVQAHTNELGAEVSEQLEGLTGRN